MYQDLLTGLKSITPEEHAYLQQVMAGMTQQQAHNFIMFYSGKRIKSEDILLYTLLGFFGVAGVQRFVTNQIGMGIVYFITAGFCFIGTIIDLINRNDLANEFNRQKALEFAMMVRSSYPGAPKE